MKNFAKSILNYFAAYNETRFRFTTKIAQAWTNNELTLDISIFPEFENDVFAQLNKKERINLEVNKQQYFISIDSDKFRELILNKIELNCTLESVATIREELRKDLPDNEFPEPSEIYRKLALQIRKVIGDVLIEMQEQKKQEIKKELNLERLPVSTLNSTSIEQEIYDNILRISAESDEAFIQKVTDYISKEYKPKLVMYDLFILLRTYSRFINTNSIYMYFHELILEDISYPLIGIEVDYKESTESFILSSPRKIVMLNTPAINAARFGTVLTTPRACTLDDLKQYTEQIEMYLNSYYLSDEPFVLEPIFKHKVAKGKPEIRSRLGLQIVAKEDRKILDYSELITTIESGAGEKFNEILETYVEGNTHNTADEVFQKYQEEYPNRTYKTLVSDIPLPLNANQRKILTAARNEKNKIIVIDGPPGTGKSYTITALVYLANLLGKTLLITSHKKQALDVVEDKLTEQFKKIHPNAKPAILRLTKSGEQTVNTIDNTLSSAVINATKNRTYTFNESAVQLDKQTSEDEVKAMVTSVWENELKYPNQMVLLQELLKLQNEIGYEGELPARDYGENINWDNVKNSIKIISEDTPPISLDQLTKFVSKKNKLQDWLTICNKLHGLPVSGNTTTSQIEASTLYDFIKKLQPLFATIDPITQLKTLSLDTVQLPSRSEFAEAIKWVEFEKVRELVRNLHSANGGLGRFLGSKEKREHEYALSLDYPAVFAKYQKNGAEQVLIQLELVYKKIIESKIEHPELSQEYLFTQATSIEEIKKAQDTLHHIEYENLVREITHQQEKPLSELTVLELKTELEKLNTLAQSKEQIDKLYEPLEIMSFSAEDISKLYTIISFCNKVSEELTLTDIESISQIFNHYKPLWLYGGINTEHCNSLSQFISGSDTIGKITRFIDIFRELSTTSPVQMDMDATQRYTEKTQRLLEHKNQIRFGKILDFRTEVQRILETVATNKRLTSEQASLLFTHIPCIIAPPDLISQYFPMEKDMIDWLIIDEASQVSIAESLSLILRAKQSMVFGDELQYGAVGATNVSLEYSKQYFKNILTDFEIDKQTALSEEEKERLANDVSQSVTEEESKLPDKEFYKVTPGTKEWLKTFSIRTSTLDFAKAMANYSDSLTVHFRSYPEIIQYSNEKFYKPSEINLEISRIRTKPIGHVLRFVRVNTKGLAGDKINLDEIEEIAKELRELHNNGYKGSIGIICSFQNQTDRMNQILKSSLDCYAELVEKNKLKVWFVGEVQGEERDTIFYSFVADKAIGNASLSTIYPVVGGVADNIRNLRMQRLNVGFSRAKDAMVFVHSMDIKDYADTRLGDALDFYYNQLSSAQDLYVEDESVFESPAEKELYSLITQTEFFNTHRQNVRLVAQFEIGKYIREELRKSIPDYRVDFLLTHTLNGKDTTLILEYDGLEFHTKNPHAVSNAISFDQEYLEYDIQRQLELESYGYRFLRINKFTLIPKSKEETRISVLNQLLYSKFIHSLT